MFIIIYESMRSVLSIWSSLFEINCSNFTKAREDFFNLILLRKLRIDREGNKERLAILVGKVVTWLVTNDFRSLVEVRELGLDLVAIDFETLTRVKGSTGTTCKSKPYKGVKRIFLYKF